MAPRRTRRWCCYGGDKNDEHELNARHPILARRSRRNLRYVPSSLDSGSYGNSDIELSRMTTQRLSEDDNILPDPRTLGGGDSPSTGNITRPFTPTGVARMLRSKLSRDSAQFRVKRQHRKLQKKSLRNLHQKDSTISLNDLVGLHLAGRAPSRGGYDADAQPLTDSDLLARLDRGNDAERGRSRTAVPISTPLKQKGPRARMPHVKYTAIKGSPLIKVQRASSSEGSSAGTAPRTSISTYTTGSPSTPIANEDDTGTFVTATISDLDTTDVFSTKAVAEPVVDTSNETYLDSSDEHPKSLPRLSLKDFSQSSLHLTGPLAKPESSLMQIPELEATSSFHLDTVEAKVQVVAVPRVPTPHLYDMRISQHLRSLSAFSEDDFGQSQPGSYQSPSLPYQVEVLPIDQDQTAITQGKSGLARLGVPDSRGSTTRSSRIDRRNVARSSEEDLKDKSSLLRTCFQRGRADSASVMYDGQSDQHLGPPATQRRSSSVSDNYEDTAAVWQKALNGYQMDKAMKDKKRNSNSVNSGGSPMRRSRATSVESAGHELDPLEPEHDRLLPVAELRPVNTEHSFSHLHRPGQEVETYRQSSEQSAEDFFRALNTVTAEQARASTHASTVGPLDEQLDVPDITLTRPERESQVPVPTTPLQKKRFAAWARFPSEDRAERNGSAGAADNVITRDFAPASPSKSDAGDDELGISGKKKKSMISRTKAMMKKGKNDLPLLFKARNHEAQGGHRTSIAAGGDLEYPELEMLPGADIHEMTQMDAWKHAIESGPAPERTHSIDDRAPEEDNTTMTKVSLVGSSDYGSAPGSPPRSVSSTRRIRMPWSTDNQAQHLAVDQDKTRRLSDEISPLDGMSAEVLPSRPSKEAYHSRSMLGLGTAFQSPGGKSLPPTLHAKLGETPTPRKRPDVLKNQVLAKIASTEGLRRSTQDLNRMLEESAKMDAEKALRAAESWAL